MLWYKLGENDMLAETQVLLELDIKLLYYAIGGPVLVLVLWTVINDGSRMEWMNVVSMSNYYYQVGC